MRNIKYIVIHCAATKEGQSIDIKDVDNWHKARGWKGVGYHYFIKLTGVVQLGRDISQVGSHVAEYNSHSIGICYCGGCDSNGTPKDTRTQEQKMSLISIILDLKKRFPNAIVQGHRDFPNVHKACPSFDAKSEYKNIPAEAIDGHNNKVDPGPEKAL